MSAAVHAAEAVQEEDSEHGGRPVVERWQSIGFWMLNRAAFHKRGAFAKRTASGAPPDKGDQPSNEGRHERNHQRRHYGSRRRARKQDHHAGDEREDAEVVQKGEKDSYGEWLLVVDRPGSGQRVG